MKILTLFVTHYQSIVFAMFALLSVIAFVNFVANAYCKQNRQLNRFRKRVVAKPSQVENNVRFLPQEYQRQWRAYKSSGAKKPSTVFEFVKLSTHYKFAVWHVGCLVISLFYIFWGAVSCDSKMIITQLAFWLASLLTIVLTIVIQNINLSFAKKTFGRFVHHLNVVVALCQSNNMTVATDQAQSIQDLSLLPKENAIDNAVNILRQKGLNNPRTVDEQRKLNLALNNLLQSYSNK